METRPYDPFDVAIIGAGPAGTCLAALLERAGVGCVVIEAARFPRFCIGESLLPRCMESLDRAGLVEPLTAQGFQRKRGAFFGAKGRGFRVDFSWNQPPAWSFTWQVPRARFDATLAGAVEARGVPVLFGHRVVEALPGPSPALTVEDPEGTRRRIACRFIADASGHGAVLARLLGLAAPPALAPRRTLFAHFTGDRRPPPPADGDTWSMPVGPGAWTWVIPLGGADDLVSVGVIAPADFFTPLPSDPERAIRAVIETDPDLSARLSGVRLAYGPAELSGWSSAVTTSHGEGFGLVGNASGFLDPVFSSGVMLSLEGASRAAPAIVDLLAGRPMRWKERVEAPILAGNAVFRDYIAWWYDGTLDAIFGIAAEAPVMRHITAVLAGDVWETNNPFVVDRRRKVPQLRRVAARLIQRET